MPIDLGQFYGGGGTWKTQEFTSSGTWTHPNPGTEVYCIVEVIGGGGGGGSGAVGRDNQYSFDGDTIIVKCQGGGGGGAGQRKIYHLVETANVSVTVGSGGSGASSAVVSSSNGGAPAPGNTGGDGGDSSFGNYGAKGGSRGWGGACSGFLTVNGRVLAQSYLYVFGGVKGYCFFPNGGTMLDEEDVLKPSGGHGGIVVEQTDTVQTLKTRRDQFVQWQDMLSPLMRVQDDVFRASSNMTDTGWSSDYLAWEQVRGFYLSGNDGGTPGNDALLYAFGGGGGGAGHYGDGANGGAGSYVSNNNSTGTGGSSASANTGAGGGGGGAAIINHFSTSYTATSGAGGNGGSGRVVVHWLE